MDKKTQPSASHYGFTLVELSVVLVMLGLLIGGVMSGQHLIRSAALRSVTTELHKYQAAINTFKLQYNALPGDMSNATSYWGTAHATPATCFTTASTTTATCNGNGDGSLTSGTGSNEIYRFWQHLANAGLIEGQYDGITHGSTSYSSTAANSPASRLSSAYWFTYPWATTYSSVAGIFDGTYGPGFTVGGLVTDNAPYNPVSTPLELWNIDSKIDDGKPATGKVVVYALSGGLEACTTATGTTAAQAATLTADYLLTLTSQTCIAWFRQAY